MQKIVILTGAGISAESGVPTFRDSGGLWEGHRIEEVATPGGFQRNPDLVHRFYNLRRAAVQKCDPNPAHRAIARLQTKWPDCVTLVTQNVDDLHERGGSRHVFHMHGELLRVRCVKCSTQLPWTIDLGQADICPSCGHREALRPDIVWFGEMPYFLDEIDAALRECDLFAAIGTSGVVYPAAGMVDVARGNGARTIEFNLDRTDASPYFSECRVGPVSQTVPAWVAELECSLCS